MTATRPRGLRARLLLAVVVAVAVALSGLIVTFNLILDRRLDDDVQSLLRARTSAQVAALSAVDGRLRVPEARDAAAFDSPTWIFAGQRELEHPVVSAPVERSARGLADRPRRTVDVGDPHTRLLAVPVLDHGRRTGTVVSAASLAPYDRAKRIALIASVALGAIVLVGVLMAARWVLAAALRPVARMTADAAAWSERELDRRFGMGPPRDELTRLAATLDSMLDRLSAGLRREQRFSAELSHELRTPLARITTEAQLALRSPRNDAGYREALAAILRSSEQMSRALEALMAAARAEIGGRRGSADAAAVAAAAVESCAAVARARGVTVEVSAPALPLRIAAEADLVERILHPLVDNACRYASTRVRVELNRVDGGVSCVVRDDGPGVTPDERERIFDAGVRGSAAGGREQAGAGLGLALARRLAAAASGELEAEASPSGGSFRLRLPAALP